MAHAVGHRLAKSLTAILQRHKAWSRARKPSGPVLSREAWNRARAVPTGVAREGSTWVALSEGAHRRRDGGGDDDARRREAGSKAGGNGRGASICAGGRRSERSWVISPRGRNAGGTVLGHFSAREERGGNGPGAFLRAGGRPGERSGVRQSARRKEVGAFPRHFSGREGGGGNGPGAFLRAGGSRGERSIASWRSGPTRACACADLIGSRGTGAAGGALGGALAPPRRGRRAAEGTGRAGFPVDAHAGATGGEALSARTANQR